jgi:hypothetical protein
MENKRNRWTKTAFSVNIGRCICNIRANFFEGFLIRVLDTCEPIIAYANNAELPPGSRSGYLTVPSRMLLWCHGGEGEIEINGIVYPINEDHFYFTPWNHHVTYYPDSATPLSLSGIHLIPDLPRGEPVYFAVPHAPRERFTQNHVRRDAPMLGLEGLIHGAWQNHVPLSLLSEYILHWYRNGTPDEETARWLAQQLIKELQQATHSDSRVSNQLPERLQRILGHIWNHLHVPLSIAELASTGRCTPSTVQRMFHKYLGDTPTGYIQKRRMAKAAELLVLRCAPSGGVR